MDLRNKAFELVENQDGLAGSRTRMAFNNSHAPFEATYSGPNVSNGHVLVTENDNVLSMLYHSLTTDQELVAGKATVSFTNHESGGVNMQLHWQWLTGDLSSGISIWSEVSV